MVLKQIRTVCRGPHFAKQREMGTRSNRDRLHIGIILFSAFVVMSVCSGCAVFEKAPASRNPVAASENPDGSIRQEYPGASDSNSSDKAFVDEDFEFLEEEFAERELEVADPLEPVNRVMFFVNDTLYFWVFKPVGQVYKDIAPEPVRIGIRNFFNNLTTPIRFTSCLLQGKGGAAGTELNRFLINTTIGILGFGDPARWKYGLEPVREDLGQTLAVYGLGDGFYLVLPMMGPSTLRDTAGRVGDAFLNPVHYVEPTETAIGISVFKGTNEFSFRIGEYEQMKAEAVDPYVAIRNIYLQYRKKQIEK